MWDQICSLMHGTEKGIQMKRTNLLTKLATFKGREGELLEDTYHRFCNMINELRKNNLKKSQLDINIQFINSLRSEWRRFASNIQQNRNLEDIDIDELFELRNHNQDEVLEILGKEKKAEKYADPLALVVDRRQYPSGRSSRYEEDYDVPSGRSSIFLRLFAFVLRHEEGIGPDHQDNGQKNFMETFVFQQP
ncbi:hypothetical protein OSB04_un000320 [Centaurea solstitialis]|uniref:Uncharacterized protein n=1 Tax=Centaurea solstitialis TaxID=347529 RepID=A0AA38SQP7_9ASTR|nr:hypothetical protein OSB04_un000320 [Centaurea solstitialis]